MANDNEYVLSKTASEVEKALGKALLIPDVTEADYGKVLTATADGFVWGEAGEVLEDVEGVLF